MAIVNVRGVLLTGAVPTDGGEPFVPAPQPVVWPAGQEGAIVVTVVDPTGDLVDVTGATAKMAVKARAADAPVLEVAGTLSDPTHGKISFPLVAANTSGLRIDIYRADWWIKISGVRSQVIPPSNFSVPAAELPSTDGP
jgi:hypothetical protein